MGSHFQKGTLSLAVLLASATLATAAQAESPTLEEVIVTAQKRAESLQDIPVAISAFNADDIEAMQLHNAQDIGMSSANLQTPSYPTSENNLALFIRGIGNSDSIVLTKDPTVGVYYDGVYAARSTGLLADLADLERVEILRGPQGTLYGRNTTGGAINFINAKPTGELGFKQTLSAGDYGYFRSTSHLNLPEMAGFSAKVTATFSERDGWVENNGPNETAGQPYNDFYSRDNEGFRAAVSYTGMEKLEVSYSYDYADMTTTPAYFQYDGPLGFDATTFNTVVAAYPDLLEDTYSPLTGDKFAYYLPDTDTEVEGHNLTIAYDFNENLSLKSITGYREYDDDLSMNFANSFGGAGTIQVHNVTNHDQFSQELQLLGTYERVKYVAGLYYFEEDGDQTEAQYLDREVVDTTGDLAFDFITNAPCGGGVNNNPACTDLGFTLPYYLGTYAIDSNVDSWALFGQMTWTPDILDDRLDLTVGLRYTDDDRDSSRDSDSATWPFNAFVPGETESDVDEVDYTLIADYSWTDNISTYAKIATGFRSPGSSRQAPDFEAGIFDDEGLISYELGWKTELWDNRLRANGAVFFTEVNDTILDFLPDPVNAPQFVQVVNAGDTDIYGLELDVTAALTESLMVSVSYAYLDYDFNNVIFPDGSDLTNFMELLWAPENAYSVVADYRIPLDFGELHFHMDYSWQDDQFALANTTAGEIIVEDFGQMNARIALGNVELFGGNWQFAGWVRNATDEDSRNYQIGTTSSTYQAPRMYGGEVIFEF